MRVFEVTTTSYRAHTAIGFGLVVATVAGVHALTHFGHLLDDAQTFCFPVFLIALYLLVRPFQFPALIFAFSFVLWLLSALHIRGLAGEFPRAGYITRLPGTIFDQRRVYQESNRLSLADGLAPIGLLQSRVENLADAERWLTDHPDVSFLAFGDGMWASLAFTPDFSWLTHGVEMLESDRRIATVKRKERPLRIVFAPRSFALPLEPENLAAQYFTWLAAGLSRDHGDGETLRENRRSAFFEAASVLGPWKSSAPRSLAYFFLGTMQMLEALSTNHLQPAELRCAIQDLEKAGALVQQRYSPELDAMIANNRAVALVLSGGGKPVRSEARRLLNRAARARDESGNPFEVSNVARENIAILRKDRLLPRQLMSRRSSSRLRRRGRNLN